MTYRKTSQEIEATQGRLIASGVWPQVVKICKWTYHTDPLQVLGSSQTKNAAMARHECWVWLREQNLSLREIAKLWGVDLRNITSALQKSKERVQ